MFVRGDGAVVTSASDLTVASACEYAFVRALDAKLGKADPVAESADAMLARAGALGTVHENRVLEQYRAEFGAGVVEIPSPDARDPASLAIAVEATRSAFARGADVVFQATFATDGPHPFLGFADFIVRRGGVYRVQDTKLARRAKVTALLQLAAYAERLADLGVAVDDEVDLILGDGSVSTHRVSDIAPVYRRRRTRLLHMVDERVAEQNSVLWLDARYAACGHCDACAAELDTARDLYLVAGMRGTQRARLFSAGVTTIDELAQLPPGKSIEGMTARGVEGLRMQARAQLGRADAGPPPVEVFAPAALGAIPAPDPGDIFFDFEGDPLYAERLGDRLEWGIDYLFGLVGPEEDFTAFWAHDLAAEKQALLDFLAYVGVRRQQHPNLHIYHYAAYERTHLLAISARHGVGEKEVDDLLRENVLVDLYPIVRKALRIGTPSYSIKKLEPLYMGDEVRESDVQTGAASVDEYVRYTQARDAGDTATAEEILADIADYNRYDVVSTHRLRDWLLGIAQRYGVEPLRIAEEVAEQAPYEPSPLNLSLLDLAADAEGSEREAYALAAAAIDYNAREAKSFWWEHFSRLVEPFEEWEDARDVFRVESAEVVVGWFREGRQRSDRRRVRLRGTWAPGSRPGDSATAIYDFPAPFDNRRPAPGSRSYLKVSILEEYDDGVLIEEVCPTDAQPWLEPPLALAPAIPFSPVKQTAAIAEWGSALVTSAPEWPRDPVVDVLRRTPPRTRSGELAPMTSPDDAVGAVTASLLDLDSSYLAVQGPPGTGKTYVASRVIARLIRENRWRIGVVAQSHAVVENVLAEVVAAGIPAELVGKKRGHDDTLGFTVFEAADFATFAADHASTGFVVGGTVWDFPHPDRFPRRSLDLLVIDEAGQFSLANTISASVAARNLLLLGDPQQLPQVSQGIHPAPVDQSALGFVSDGHDVLPADLGYFLPESRRMDAAVTAPVSRLSYEGALRSHQCTRTRRLEGLEPGLHPVPVLHAGNATESLEEAARVVEIVRAHLGRPWTNPAGAREADPLQQSDFIVVTPYNAQVALVREALDAAGLPDVVVGTVDKFQGREAVISITTLAASSAADVPRGMSFLIMKNRLNVAISRAQWAAFLVYSPGIEDYLPHRPEGVAELSAFLTLIDDAG
jgi:uncharacterized protein